MNLEKALGEDLKKFQENNDPEKYPNPQRPAYPTNNRMFSAAQGLTKREYFAGKILQAMLSNPAIVQHNKEKDSYLTDDVIMSGLVVHAINYTDELLKALEQ